MTPGIKAVRTGAACRYVSYWSADPMIAVCADQRPIRVRATSGYFGGAVPVLSGGISRSTRVPRYPSDMSDAEWAVTEPMLPVPAWKQGRGGRPAEWCRRDIVDAIRYLVKEGI